VELLVWLGRSGWPEGGLRAETFPSPLSVTPGTGANQPAALPSWLCAAQLKSGPVSP